MLNVLSALADAFGMRLAPCSDIIKGIANGSYPATTMIGEICSRDLATIAPSATVDEALRHMRDNAPRYFVVVANGQPVGIVSMSDIASQQRLASSLTHTSAAPPLR